MKTFAQLRESKKDMPAGQHVYSAKLNKHDIMIHKEKNKFVAYIDSEKLDSYNSLEDAKKATTQFIKMAGNKQ
jgi:hypothetical protein